MIAAVKLFAVGLLLAFVYSILSYALRPLADIDMLDVIGLGFALSLSVLMWMTIFNLVVATFAFIAAAIFPFTPLAVGVKSILHAMMNPRKQISERDLINQLYPPPLTKRVMLHE